MDFGASSWNRLQDRYYRKFDVYESLSWSPAVNVGQCKVAGAPHAGPIATIRDTGKILRVSSEPLEAVLKIHSCSGNLLAEISWQDDRLVEMGWSDAQNLVCILSNGQVVVFSTLGEELQRFTLGEEAKEFGIDSALIWGGGLVALTGNLQLVAVTNFSTPKPRKLPDPELGVSPYCMAILEPSYSHSRDVEVLLSTPSSLIAVDIMGRQELDIAQGPFTRMTVCPNGKIIACFTQEGHLWVTSSDFSKNLSDFATESQVPPNQLTWCGTDSVMLHWDRLLMMVGPYGDWLKYNYDEPISLIQELDGVRVLSSSRMELIQRVPDPVVDVFKIGSCTPAALLFDAHDLFQRNDAKADESIRSTASRLSDAVDTCLEAAAQEWDSTIQKQLLRSASYGKSFLEFYHTENFVNMAKTLRVLNMLRRPDIGMPVTYRQYTFLTPDVIVNRLIQKHLHFQAVQICDLLGLPKERVVVHWACEKVKATQDLPADEVIASLRDRLSSCQGTSYAQIAATAHHTGRTDLAKMILDDEPRATDQVPLLIEMRDETGALVKAIESGDSDLVYLVIMHIKRTHPIPEFFETLRHMQEAQDLYVAYAKHQDRDLLQSLFAHVQRTTDLGMTVLQNAYQQMDTLPVSRLMKTAATHFSQAKDSQTAKIVEDHIRLLEIQKECQQSFGDRYVGLSMAETIVQLFRHGQIKRATKVVKEFKLGERRYYYMKIKGLAEGKDWEELDKFAAEKSKPPVGFEAFAEACMTEGNTAEAVKYAEKVTDHGRRCEIFLAMNRLRDAAEAAAAAKDGDLLSAVRSRAKDPATATYIDSLAADAGLA